MLLRRLLIYETDRPLLLCHGSGHLAMPLLYFFVWAELQQKRTGISKPYCDGFALMKRLVPQIFYSNTGCLVMPSLYIFRANLQGH